MRDSSAGIGTVTYYDKSENYFAGLGHGICDCDTYTLMPLASGEAVIAEISSVTKSTNGSPGSLNGYFSDKVIGKLPITATSEYTAHLILRLQKIKKKLKLQKNPN